MMYKIAFRSIFRNTRRSLTTMMTIAIGTAAVLVFGGFTIFTTYGLQTSTVQRTGHLTVYNNGFFSFGAGAPAAWGINGYPALLRLIQQDPVLKPMTAVVTPIQSVFGIAGNSTNDTSKTFFGVGFIPSDHDRMKQWNDYGVGAVDQSLSGLTDGDTSRGLVGLGLARILGLCQRLHQDNCPPERQAPVDPSQAAQLASISIRDFSDLGDAPTADERGAEPRIDLLGATANGAPNVVTLQIHRVDYQGVKELDENYVGMHLALAQQLVYGRGEHKVTGIVLQLNHTKDLDVARTRLRTLFKAHHLDLEVRDYAELTPFYAQALGLFRSIFLFISVIIGIVVLFTVTNAMGMSVVERTDEIGTTRAMGVRRQGVRQQFLLEGAIIGVFGATIGVLIAYAVAFAVNHAGLTWMPPGNAQPVPFRLYLVGAWGFSAVVWAGLIVVATLASLLPASRAARLRVVDALRHV